ncbi:chromosome segregation protein SMC [Halobacteria archaeon AArc-dxtr1]|nr:chromosome segregation protein SMC [Halobacteria archaeon AArc-dxtr1]
MSPERSSGSTIEVTAENVGGIDQTTVTLRQGVNVLTGRNATNRTSFLQAIMAALGSERPSLKGDATTGSVELQLDQNRYTRSLGRQNGTVAFGGEPYLSDPELADLFACLLESNDARRAVEQGAELRDLIMRPVDTDEIRAEIELLKAEKRDLDESIAELDRLEDELPNLERQRTSLAKKIEAATERIDTLESDLDDHELNVDESRTQKEDIDDAFTELRTARKELEAVEYDLETEQESLSELEREREELADEIDALEEADVDSAAQLEGQIAELRDRKQSLDSTAGELQNVIQFNERRLEGDGSAIEASLGSTSDDVTDRLLESDPGVVCWTCGTEVGRSHIESTLDRLREIHRETLEERTDVQDRIDDLSSRRSAIAEREQRRNQLKQERERTATQLKRQRERVTELREKRADHRERVAELEERTDEFEETNYSDVLETHRELNRAELEREQHQEKLASVTERIESLEERIEEREALAERRSEVESELAECRTRVERIEREAIEAFNDHIESLLSLLEYANLDRIWIERLEPNGGQGSPGTASTFELHIVRAAEDGTAYEDTIEHLSESEREVTGLVFALAGYLVHDVYEEVPFMLLDSLEAIDSDRIAALVEYFESYVDCLVVALLPEDAAALPEEYHYIEEI